MTKKREKEKEMRRRYKDCAYYCGENHLDVQVYPEYAVFKGKRKTKFKPSSEFQKNLNDENAKKYVTRLINNNYTFKDYRLDLTYRNDCLPENYEKADHQMKLYIRRVNHYAKKNEIKDVKIFGVTGYGERRKRLHHHLIITGSIPLHILSSLWGKGFVTVKPLIFDKFGVEGIVRYFIRHIEENKKRGIKCTYYRSRNHKEPVPKPHSGRLRQKAIEFMFTFTDTSVLERLYPGYELVDISPLYNEHNGGYYFTCRFYKPPNRQRKKKKMNST